MVTSEPRHCTCCLCQERRVQQLITAQRHLDRLHCELQRELAQGQDVDVTLDNKESHRAHMSRRAGLPYHLRKWYR